MFGMQNFGFAKENLFYNYEYDPLGLNIRIKNPTYSYTEGF